LHAVHHNWIDGRPAPASSGDGFEVKTPRTKKSLGRWPRSGARELEAALAACERAETRWSLLSVRERRQRLERALDRWLDDGDGAEQATLALGCSARELHAHGSAAAASVERLLAGGDHAADDLDPRTSGTSVAALDWTEGWHAPARFAFGSLLKGRTVVLVSDPRLPMVADGLARALADSTDGALAVLHDDGRTVVRAAFGHERVARLHLPSTSEAAPELWARAEPELETVIERGFGAGVVVTREKKLCVRTLANTSYVVRTDRDLGAQAEEVVERAFGRVAALSGCAPGRVGRVLAPARVFSRFTELLLDALENDPDATDPIDLVRALAPAHAEHAFALGHDEGATAIFTGFPDDDLSFPLVFTNVDERMKLARLARPSPVLCLMRVADVAAAREAAARIDV
jgi:acyl-CoA reductase-like NAD-dependent aldehyde dehydrogenase